MVSTPVSPEPLSTIVLDKRRRRHDVNPLTLLSPKIKRQRTTEHDTAPEAVKLAVCLLEDEFKLREAASEAFPPKIASSHIRTSVSKYEDEMSAASLRSVCCSCGRFVAAPDIYKIDGQADFILPPQRTLDRCGHHENSWDFCAACHGAVSRGNIPKFSASNLVNVTTFQDYPSVLGDLTAVEECLIAKCHPVGTILKLRPGGRPSPSNYNALRGHMIVIPQDPGPLLQILPSPELRLDNLIKVFWLGKRAPADAELKPFLQVRKDKVLAALQYLVRYSLLYHDLTINHALMGGWSEDFIPPEIRDNIICLGSSDHHEREGYTVNLETGNYENDLHAAQDADLGVDGHEALISGSVYTDVNGERQDPNARMIDTLRKVVARDRYGADESVPTTEEVIYEPGHRRGVMPTISYAVRGQSALMNNREQPYFFTAAFPTLFPTGTGGHQDERTVPSNHPCRFARHKTFISSLGNALLVKHRNWRSAEGDIASLTIDQLEDAAKAVADGAVIDDPVIQRLQRNIVTIGMQVPESFSQKLKRRSEIKGLIVRDGMPDFWITINPSDLRNPLVLLLAGVEYSGDAFPTANAAIRQATATSNPVAVAQFFHHT
ncbi:hypothetical protein B0O99DRAFT_640674, partial [Bisporella sp. PMI_857]